MTQHFDYWITAFNQYLSKQQFPNSPQNLYEPNEYFLSLGGKRIRPTLCMLGYQLMGKEVQEDCFKLATAVEYFHNFTLIHDDVMDCAALRRGKPTVHTKYGQNTAILSGDVLLIYAYQSLQQISQKSELDEILSVFNKTAIEVCEGQQMDMDFENRVEVSVEEYLEMIKLKTSVLLAASLEMGAILAGASIEERKKVYEFGINLGLAFQIQDDYLDSFGDEALFGKEIGGDIKQNKKTILSVFALSHADENLVSSYRELMNSSADDKVNKVKQIFTATKSDEFALHLKQQYYQKALSCIEALQASEKDKEPLLHLSEYLLHRTV